MAANRALASMKKLEEGACGNEILGYFYFTTPGFNSTDLGDWVRVRNCNASPPAQKTTDNRSCCRYQKDNAAMCADYLYKSGCDAWNGKYAEHQLCHNDSPGAKQPTWSC